MDQDKHDRGSDSRADLCHNSAWEEVARGAAHAGHHHHLDVEERPGDDPGGHHEGPAPRHAEDHVRAGERRGQDIRGEQAARHHQRKHDRAPGAGEEEGEEGHQGVGHGAEGDVGLDGGLDGGQRSVREAAHQELHQPQGVDGGLSVGYDLAAKFVFTSLFS